jgi:hypothetical protein
VLDETLIDVPTDLFGGYCPAIPPSELAPGAASIAADVMFPQGAVRTRGGLAAYFGARSPLDITAAINGLKTYLTPTGLKRLMVWDSLGNLWKENPEGFLNLVNSRSYQNLYYKSETLFGREYQAFFDARGGFDLPRQFDDTNWDRVSQSGPGAGPQVSNFQPGAATVQNTAAPVSVNIVASPNGIKWGGFEAKFFKFRDPETHQWEEVEIDFFTYFTVTTTTPHGYAVGNRITIAGSTSTPSVNFTWTIATVPSATTFTVNKLYQQEFAVNGGGGTAAKPANSLTRTSNNVLANTAAAHGFEPGWTVIISGFANIAIGGGITAISQANGVATCTTTNPHGLIAGAAAVITGTANFNGTWIVTGVPSANSFTFVFLATAAAEAAGAVATPLNGTFTILSTPTATSFTYQQLGPDEVANTAGTATIQGNISAGLHNVSVAFITRQGFITPPSVPVPFYAAGGQLAGLSQIAIGPPNVVGRILMFTPFIAPPATAGSFFSITSAMVINDNTTTIATVDFLDSVLISSFQCNYLFSQVVLGESACILPYNSRLAWLGERAKVPNFIPGTLDFDGGFGLDAANRNFPLGWTEDANFYAGGNSARVLGFATDFGDAYVITGDGATAVRGKITQTAFQDYLNVPILQKNTAYSVRVRARKQGALAQGVLHVNLQSSFAGFTTGGLQVAAAELAATFQEFTAAITDQPMVNPPGDLLLQIYADGTPSNGASFVIESIEVFPTNAPFYTSTARFSHAFNPESYDGTTGQVQVRPGDGQQLRAGFPLRNNLYLAKDHYLGYVTDDGVNEPAAWAFNEVSATIGICGGNAVDWTEEWAVFAERAGLYICWGSDPVKITPEIQTDASRTGKISWESINWLYASTIWVRIDRINKHILVGAPVNGATSPNCVFMLDYKWLETAEDIAGGMLVSYSAFTGKMLSHGRGRRWAVWTIAANSMCFAERNDGTAQPFFGNAAGNGKVYVQMDCSFQASDDGAVINSRYRGYACPSHMEEQMYRLGSHRKLLGYLKFRAVGVGSLLLSIITSQRKTALRPYLLAEPSPGDATGYGDGGYGTGGYGTGSGAEYVGPAGDGERPVNMTAERFFIEVGTSAVGSWFQLEKLIPSLKKSATSVVRGVSA